MIFRFVWETLQGLPEYYQREKGLFIFTLVVVLALIVFHIVRTVRITKQIQSIPLQIFYFVAELIGIFAVILAGVLFNRAAEIGNLYPEMLNTRFFLEIIGAAVVYGVFYGWLYNRMDIKRETLKNNNAWSTWDEHEYDDTVGEYGKAIGRAIVIILASVFGIFFGTGIIQAGPVLFGKRLGEWAFNTYAAWTVNVIVTFVSILIELPLIRLFGNKVMQAVEAYEDAVDEVIDKHGDEWFDRLESLPWKKILGFAAAILVIFFVGRGILKGIGENTTSNLPAVLTQRDVEKLQKQAGEGDTDAMVRLAEAYSYGWGGLERNSGEAVSLYRQAAEAGNAIGQYQTGRAYEFGDGVEQDYEEAFRWILMSAEQGYADAQREVGLFYHIGRAVARDYGEALKWYRLAAEQNHPYALRDVGYMYAFGEGVEADTEEAMRWYQWAVAQGNISAYKDLANLYLINNEVREPDKAAQYLAMGAEAGDSQSAFALAKMYETGDGVELDYTKAFDLYMKYADYHSEAWYNLGRLYEEGKGVTADYEQAVSWYQKAAEYGNQKAKEALQRLEGE